MFSFVNKQNSKGNTFLTWKRLESTIENKSWHLTDVNCLTGFWATGSYHKSSLLPTSPVFEDLKARRSVLTDQFFTQKKSGFFTCLYWTTPTKVPLSPNPPKTKIKSERKNNKKQQWLQPFWNTNSLAGDGYPFLLRPFFRPFVECQRVGHFSLNFRSTPGKMMPRVKCEKWNMLGVDFERFWKFWWIFVLGPSNSTVCAWHYGLRVLVFVLRDSKQKLQIIVMETVIRFGKIVVTPWRIEFVLFFLEKLKSLSETRN